jgi:xanthine dehydrogenase accessory factor
MQKRNLGTSRYDAPLVIAMGPGFIAGEDCHAIIETHRGHRLGRVIWQGAALDDTGTPGIVAGYGAERVLRAPEDGYVIPAVEIGEMVEQGDLIATLNEHTIRAPFPGVLRGIIHPSVYVWKDLKIGDLDPRGDIENCYTISDKSLAIGGGVLEAILSSPIIRHMIHQGALADAAV